MYKLLTSHMYLKNKSFTVISTALLLGIFDFKALERLKESFGDYRRAWNGYCIECYRTLLQSCSNIFVRSHCVEFIIRVRKRTRYLLL